jgi:uncharacterized protein YbjT (DUF2867 family)
VLIAVVGATGRQGSALIDAIASAADGLAVRALVRSGRGGAVAALAPNVTEIVEADLDDLLSLVHAFEGADGAYCVTPPDGEETIGRETRRARNMARAAHETGLRHVVWSTQEDTRPLLTAAGSTIPTLGGRYRVPSYDAKGEADDAFRELGVPTTFMRTSFYWESLLNPYVGPERTANRSYVIRWPLGDAKMPGIAVADIGRCARALFTRSSEYIGRTVGLCAEKLSGAEIAATLGAKLGVVCRYEPIELDVFRRHDVPGAAGIANMFAYKRELEDVHSGYRDAALTRTLNPSLQTLAEWLRDESVRAAFRGRLSES